jgi:hypothetical protein
MLLFSAKVSLLIFRLNVLSINRIEYWDLPLLLYLDLSVPLCSEVFVLWTWGLWCLVHIYLELLYFLAGLFPLLVCSVLFCYILVIFLLKISFVWYEDNNSCWLSISACLIYLLFQIFTLSLCVYLALRYVFCRQQIVGSYFMNQSDNVFFNWRVKSIYT